MLYINSKYFATLRDILSSKDKISITVDNGEVATVKRLTLSLTWDHRVLDGVPAAEFCRAIVELLAEPTRLD